jgi:HTH-type transcriptional regulator, cell division transcriptional repressor
MARKTAKPPVTQADLAARLQIQGIKLDRVAISKIETGYREVTDFEVNAVAKALGVPINWLFGEDT